MKIASTLTNTTPNETGLPSLLSCGPCDAGSSSDAASVTADARKNDPAQDGQSAATFEAILAMFNAPQIVPQNLPQPQQPIETSESGSAVTAAADAVNAVNLETLSNVTTQMPTSDVALPRSPQVVVTGAAPLIAATTPSITATTVAGPLTTSAAVDSTTTESPTTSDVGDQVAKPFGDANAVMQNSTTQESALPDNSQSISATTTPAIAASSLLAEVETKLAASQPASEPRSQRVAPTVATKSDESTSEGIVAAGAELPTLSGMMTSGSETQPMRVSSEFSRRLLSVRYEGSDETHLRHRHSASESQIAAELIGSTNQPGELADHGVRQLDVTHLAEQVSATMQTHGSEVAAGQPVEVHLRLDPPELGMVRVHLRMSEDGVSVRFIAGDEAVTKLLESQLPDLRQSLAERGLAFAQCDVSCDSRQQQQQQSSNSDRDSDQPLFATKPITTRSWSRAAFVTRLPSALSDRVDILA